jgi:hypothetical protein
VSRSGTSWLDLVWKVLTALVILMFVVGIASLLIGD